ncbi:MAG: DUF2723 domain-containing protein [Candidatus Limnocylindrales bacterium]
MAGERLRRFRPDLRRLASPDVLDAAAAPVLGAGLTLLLVIPTLAPGVLNWDTAEFQTVGPVLGTAHPTGFPSYVILGWLASIVLQPFGDPAYRMNLLQAILAAVAVAGTVSVIQVLTGRRLIALATGLMLACSQLFWRLSTHADPHMFHLALVAILFVVLLTWDRQVHSDKPETVRRADRWLVVAAGIYGVAVANHSLALLLPPAIGLFVLVADWRIVFRPRTIVACVAVLVVTVVVLFSELPIRAAMNAPLVYGHPDTWSGFQYVVLAEQFRGSLSDPFGDLPTKAGQVMDLLVGWLGPFGMLAAVGFGTSLVRRPRYVILSGLSAVATSVFAASYANADIERYYLVPLLVAFTWVGLGAADLVALVGWIVAEARRRLAIGAVAPMEPEGEATAESEAAEPEEAVPGLATGPTYWTRRDDGGQVGWVILVGEIAVAAAMVFSTIGVVPERQLLASGGDPGAVSEADSTSDAAFMNAVLAPADGGGLPTNSVIMSWWSVSTTLWYGQKVLGLRPDIYIIDDSTRVDDNLGTVQDVFNRYLGNRPVFTIRLDGGVDGMAALSTEYDMQTYSLNGGFTISRVVSRKAGQ